jgi:hypothetical protein
VRLRAKRARRLANVSAQLALSLCAADVDLRSVFGVGVARDAAAVVRGVLAAVRDLVADGCPAIRWGAPWAQRLELHLELAVDGYQVQVQVQVQGLYLDLTVDDSRTQRLYLVDAVDDYWAQGASLVDAVDASAQLRHLKTDG